MNTQNAQSSASGGYLQDTWDVTDKVKIESGLRIDNVRYKNNNYNNTFIATTFQPHFYNK